MDALTGVWTVFCLESNSTNNTSDCGKFSSFSSSLGSILHALIHSSSCINHGFIISVDLLLLFMFLFKFVHKGSQVTEVSPPAISQRFSCLEIFSAIFNGGLGFAYLGLGFWVMEEKWREGDVLPLHWWLVLLTQGFTWTILSLTVSLRSRQLAKFFVRVWSATACLFTGFLCISGSSLLVINRKVSIQIVLDVLSLPGGLLLLLSAAMRSKSAASCPAVDKTLYMPLNDEPNAETKSERSVTPFANAGLLSRLSFWWLNPLMKKGWDKHLEEKDMPLLSEADRAESCYGLFMEQLMNRQTQTKESPSIFWTLILCHWREILISGFFALLKIITLSSGPLFLNAFIKVAEGEEAFKYEGYVLAGSLLFAKILESLSERQWHFRTRRIGLQLRSFLSAAIYRKQLRLSNKAKMVHSAGEVMNYVTVDGYRIGEFPFWFHQTWTTSLQLVIAIAIMFYAVGLATISALTVIVLTVLFNTPLAKLQHKFQTQLMMAQDKRLKATSEALSNMKVLKLYAWEIHFKEVIQGWRKVEHKWLSSFQLTKAYNTLLFWISPVLVSAATFGTCYLLQIPLGPSNVFTCVATLRLVQDPIRAIPDVIGVVIQAKVAFTRVVKFLKEPELQSRNVRRKFGVRIECSIFIKSANLSWEPTSSKPTLCNINLELKPGQKVAVCGEVGSGKSTLLAAILGEIPNIEGTMEVRGTIAYVSQTAWIQSGTIQENILFGSPMDRQKYQEAIEKCSLVKDLEMLPFRDLTEIGERGVNLSGGQKQRIQLARALYRDADIYLLDDPFSAVDAHTATSLFNDCIMGALSGKTVLLVTHQVDFLPVFDSILLMSNGEILQEGSYSELLTSSREFWDLVNAHQDIADTESLTKVVFLQRNDDLTSGREIKKIYTDNQKPSESSVGDQLIKQEEKETGDMGLKPYIMYLSQNKGFLYFSVATLCHLTYIVGQILQNSWMASNVQNPRVSTLQLVSVYLAIGFSGTLFLFVRLICTVVLGLQSSKSLFAQLLDSLFHAPMSFFDSTPLGRILSRVSADLSIVDLDVPFSLSFSVNSALSFYGSLGVLAVITWQVLFVSIPMVYLTICLQKYYLAAAKELMRINGTTKSLVANHLAESMAGAMTIRAFEEENRFFEKNLDLIDQNGSPFFHNFSAKEWLIQRLETISATVLSSSALVMTLLPSGTFSSGLIGMALSYGLSLNMSLVFSIQNQCILANYIVSVERINQYMHIPSEPPEVIEGSRPAPDWPGVGKVEFHDLKIRYRPDTPLVLRGISCTFAGGHKIGIVGRTGSGKTTLISALFRLVEPAGGKIIIDGLDISKVGLHDIRSCLGIIPQDPTLFNGTVRFNLDPLGQHSDQELWEVLGKCQLRDTVGEKEVGLDSLVAEDGLNWSMGQRQLFCLGRALLRKSRILVLDEATASIDNATDSILQETIRTECADCTVITVAHRIPTVMDCTMVLTMSDGKVVEYDEPLKLMKRKHSLFGDLVKEYRSCSANAS